MAESVIIIFKTGRDMALLDRNNPVYYEICQTNTKIELITSLPELQTTSSQIEKHYEKRIAQLYKMEEKIRDRE